MMVQEVTRHYTIPDQLDITENEAGIILALRDTNNPYWGLNAAVEILGLAKDALPESDEPSRRAIIAAIGILSLYSR